MVWLWFDGYGFTGAGLVQITELGYPVALDGGLLMQRNDSQGQTFATFGNETFIGSLVLGGGSGGPWVTNLGIPPSLSGTSFGSFAVHNVVVGLSDVAVTSPDTVKENGAAPFTSGNIVVLVNFACGVNPKACDID